MPVFDLATDEPAKTHLAGRGLGELAFGGLVVALHGDLGAGKTCLVRGIADGLGIDPDTVSSPTFVLIAEYAGRLPLYHFDAYRLESVDQFLDLGAAEYFDAGGVCVVEWAERVTAALPDQRLEITLENHGPTQRHLRAVATGGLVTKLLQDWRDWLSQRLGPAG